jgi:hypothetical protein
VSECQVRSAWGWALTRLQIVSTQISVNPARCSGWRSQFQFFSYIQFFATSFFMWLLMHVRAGVLPLVLRLAIVILWPVPRAHVMYSCKVRPCHKLLELWKSEHCSVLIACHVVIHRVQLGLVSWSHVYRTVSGTFGSHCSDLCNSFDLHCVHWRSHAIFPVADTCYSETINCPTEKRQWMQRVGTWTARLQTFGRGIETSNSLSDILNVYSKCIYPFSRNSCTDKKTKNSMVRVRERTIPAERPPLVGEVVANLCG